MITYHHINPLQINMYMTQGIWTYIHNVSKSEAEVEDHKIKDIPFHIVSLRTTWKRLNKKKERIQIQVNGSILA